GRTGTASAAWADLVRDGRRAARRGVTGANAGPKPGSERRTRAPGGRPTPGAGSVEVDGVPVLRGAEVRPGLGVQRRGEGAEAAVAQAHLDGRVRGRRPRPVADAVGPGERVGHDLELRRRAGPGQPPRLPGEPGEVH